MDGNQLSYQVRQLLLEGSTSSFLDPRTTYDYLYEAVCELSSALRIPEDTQTITTVASTSLYDINTNYLCLSVKNDSDEFVVKYYDSSAYYWITYKDPNYIYQNNSLSNSSVPQSFSIVGKSTLPSNITGTATANGTSSGGQCTLTDSTAPFANVSAGDSVHNSSDGSSGLVLSKTSSSAIVTALFGGTGNNWTSSDSYVIVPQSRRQLYLDPPSLTTGHTVTLRYVCRPDIVYSEYGSYRIPDTYVPAICKYAAWLYKYRDREPNFGDAWYKYWDMQLRKASMNENRNPSKMKWGVNLKRRTYGDRSMR